MVVLEEFISARWPEESRWVIEMGGSARWKGWKGERGIMLLFFRLWIRWFLGPGVGGLIYLDTRWGLQQRESGGLQTYKLPVFFFFWNVMEGKGNGSEGGWLQ